MNPHNSYVDRIAAAEVMLAGLNSNLDKLNKWGIDAEFLGEYQKVYLEVENLDNEQEALKARLKENTTTPDEKMEIWISWGVSRRKLSKCKPPRNPAKIVGVYQYFVY